MAQRRSKCAPRGAACLGTASIAWARPSSPPANRAPAWAWRWRGPLSRSTAVRASTPARKGAARPPPAPFLCRRGRAMGRLLLVDDEPAILFALKEVAKSRGHEALLARSGAEALAKLEGVDTVVTDYAMPEMDGVQLLQAIHARDEFLPVIILTAHGSERIAVRSMKTGAYEYVTKPFDIEEMSQVIDRALEARALRLQNRRLTAERAIGRSIVGESAQMRRLLEAASPIAAPDMTLLAH